MGKANLAEKFDLFDEHWSPRIVGELNEQYVKLAKLHGEFVWHYHEAEDELFLVVKGRLIIKLRNQDVVLEEGEFFITTGSTARRTASWRTVILAAPLGVATQYVGGSSQHLWMPGLLPPLHAATTSTGFAQPLC